MFIFEPHRAGIGAALVHKRKVLLIKRRNVPLISNPGIWSLLFGGTERGEKPLETAHREIWEETRLERETLRLASEPVRLMLFEVRHPEERWYNYFYVFHVDTDRIRLGWENARYRWASFDDVKEDREYTNVFCDREKVERMIRKAL